MTQRGTSPIRLAWRGSPAEGFFDLRAPGAPRCRPDGACFRHVSVRRAIEKNSSGLGIFARTKDAQALLVLGLGRRPVIEAARARRHQRRTSSGPELAAEVAPPPPPQTTAGPPAFHEPSRFLLRQALSGRKPATALRNDPVGIRNRAPDAILLPVLGFRAVSMTAKTETVSPPTLGRTQ